MERKQNPSSRLTNKNDAVKIVTPDALRTFFDELLQAHLGYQRFDSQAPDMVESESSNQLQT
jgi:hypothetical protein